MSSIQGLLCRSVRFQIAVDRVAVERVRHRQRLAQHRLQVQRRAGGDAARHLQRMSVSDVPGVEMLPDYLTGLPARLGSAG